MSIKAIKSRPGYQQMLEDARAGCFSHVAVENAERFGRNDTEALVAIDELHELGIAVRLRIILTLTHLILMTGFLSTCHSRSPAVSPSNSVSVFVEGFTQNFGQVDGLQWLLMAI